MMSKYIFAMASLRALHTMPMSQCDESYAYMTYAAQLSSQSVAPIIIGILLMEEAVVHHMATSITQLTLCQVSSEEIETATKLLEKACHKLRGIPEVPPQQITDLENATRQLRQLSHTLDICTISASYEVSEAQKALLLLPCTEKGSSTSSEEHYATMHSCRIQLTMMSSKSTRGCSMMLMLGKEHLSGL